MLIHTIVLFYPHTTVAYCTLLARSQTEAERSSIMEEMNRDAELAKILLALQDTDKGDFVREERSRRQAVRKSRVDEDVDMVDNPRDESGVCGCFEGLFGADGVSCGGVCGSGASGSGVCGSGVCGSGASGGVDGDGNNSGGDGDEFWW